MIPPVMVGPLIGAGIVLAGGIAGWTWLTQIHNPAIRKEYAAELQAQVDQAVIQEKSRAIAVLMDAERQHQERLAQVSTVRERIIRVPVSSVCASSPAISAALDGMRSWAKPADQAPSPGKPDALPKPASPP
jgi:hypothetical protein